MRRFTDDCALAKPAAIAAPANPSNAMSTRTETWCSQNGEVRSNRNTPIWAVSVVSRIALAVEAFSSAWGSHEKNGSCDDCMEAVATNRNDTSDVFSRHRWWLAHMARSKPTSPKRYIKKAFAEMPRVDSRWRMMSRNEVIPMTSQPSSNVFKPPEKMVSP